jgi:hypothetical protein
LPGDREEATEVFDKCIEVRDPSAIICRAAVKERREKPETVATAKYAREEPHSTTM